MLGHSNLKEKAEVIFGLFDFDNSLVLSKDELIVLCRCVICALQAMSYKKTFPTIMEIDRKVNAILAKYDLGQIQQITLHEFQSLVSKDLEILQLLKGYDLLLSDDLQETLESEKQAIECDSDMEVEMERFENSAKPTSEEPVIKERITSYEVLKKQLNENTTGDNTTKEKLIPDGTKSKGLDAGGSMSLAYYKLNQTITPPDLNIEPIHVYGYRSYDTRNAIRIAPNGEMVSFAGKIAYITNRKNNQQKFFQAHTNEISCIASNDQHFVTGEMGEEPTIYVWDYKNQAVKLILKGLLKYGVSHLRFSNDGKKLAAVETGPNKTIVIYDFFRLINGKAPDLKDQIVAVFRGPNKHIFDITFDPTDSTLVLGCKKSIYFVGYRDEKLELYDPKNMGGETQSILCLTSFDQYVVGGGYNGDILLYKDRKFIDSYQKVHKAPISCIWQRKGDKGFFSGSYDGTVIVWDKGFTKRTVISLSDPQLRSKVLSIKIKAVCEDPNSEGDILIGTKSGDIIESINTQNPKLLNKGHLGELTGLDKLGVRDEAVTVGKDKDLIIWDLTTFKDKKSVPLEFEGSQVASNHDGTHIAVGFANGYVEIVEAGNSTVIKKIKDRTKAITVMRYLNWDPSNVFLAVGGEDCEVLLYRVKDNYKMSNRIKGFKAPIISIDFNEKSSPAIANEYPIMQVVDRFYQIVHINVNEGKKIAKGIIEHKDANWTSWTSPVGPYMLGLYDENSQMNEFTSFCLNPDKSLLAVGTHSGDIRFYRYPVKGSNPIYTKYIAHSSPVSKIVFLTNTKQMISIGKDERDIIQWKFDIINDKPSTFEPKRVDKDEEFFKRLIEPKKIQSSADDGKEVKKGYLNDVRDNFSKDDMKLPKRQGEAPDQNLELKHIFGCKFEGVTNVAKFTSNSSIVYFTGNKAVVKENIGQEKKSTFFMRHKNDIMAMDIHKNKELVATAELAEQGEHSTIYIWHFETKKVHHTLTTNGTGGVIKLRFSIEGTKLIAINNDENHTMDIFDTQTGSLLNSMCTDRKPILDISFKTDAEFATICSNSMRFWTLRGSNLVSQLGSWVSFYSNTEGDKKDDGQQKREREPSTLVSCLYAFVQGAFFTGTETGEIYTWNKELFRGSTVLKDKESHKGAVRVMLCSKNILYTGSDDGKILSWNYSSKLTFLKQINVQMGMVNGIYPEIRSLDISSEGLYLLSTNLAAIYCSNEGNPEVIAEGHAAKGINALAVHPTTSQFITAADDQKLIKWDASQNMKSEVLNLENESFVALDWSKNGELIAAASNKGRVYLLDKSFKIKSHLDVKKESKDIKVDIIRISPDAKKLVYAVGYHLCINDINSDGTMMSPTTPTPLPAQCIFLDWSSDSEYLACSLSSFEIKHFQLPQLSEVNFSHVKDKNWVTWTQPLGLLVRGIQVDSKDLKFSPVCRSFKYSEDAKDSDIGADKKLNKLFLVAGDRDGDVLLYRYPSIIDNSDFRLYNSHAKNTTCVRFFSNDSFVVSISNKDNSIVVYKTDFMNDVKEPDYIENILSTIKDETLNDPGTEVVVRASIKNRAVAKKNLEEFGEERRDLAKYKETQEMEDDKFKLSKPWLASIRYPTDYLKPMVNNEKPPKVTITPEYVFGFRAKDVRGNLKYINDEEIVYATAAMVIIHRIKDNTQRFFMEHKTDVTCFTFRKGPPDMIASGEVGLNPNIYIWNPNSLSTLKHIKAEGLEGLQKIHFSPDGTYLLVLSTDVYHKLAVYNINTASLVYMTRGDTLRILDTKWYSPTSFASVGIYHAKIWNITDNQLKSNRMKMLNKAGTHRLLCLAINKKDIIAGTNTGAIVVWKGPNEVPRAYNENSTDSKRATIDCICVTEDNIFFSGSEGIIYIFSNAYGQVHKIDLTLATKDAFSWSVRSMDIMPDGRRIVIGTFSSEVYELETTDMRVSTNVKYDRRDITKGTYALNSLDTFEMNGLAVFKLGENAGKFMTVADDGRLRIWNTKTRRMDNFIELNLDTKNEIGGSDSDNYKLRCCTINNAEDHAAVGSKSGLIRILDLNPLKLVETIDYTKAQIYEIKYSPSGKYLAVGPETYALEVYSVPDYKRRANLKKHSGGVNHIDWSHDSYFIQTNSMAQELNFFSAGESLQHMTEIKSTVRNEQWATQSCVYGYATQGIWKEHMKVGTEVNMVDRSNSTFYKEYQILAAVDDFGEINLYKYPCVQAKAESVKAYGHSSFISHVKWSHDDKYLYTIGGEDQTIIVWRVEKQ